MNQIRKDYKSNSTKIVSEAIHKAQKERGLSAEDIAQAVAYVIHSPE
ncbi:hypothetical protein [Paucisalibacillus sp. EB02]|nr:hypothetical protein [Paucisalibacillus sp. EB02]